MRKKLLALVLAAAYLGAGSLSAYADMTREVVSVDGEMVTVKCKAKDIAKLKVGKKVKVKKK